MAELWMLRRAQEPNRAQMVHDAAVYRARMTVKLALGMKNILSRLVAMYRIPCVHLFGSLTTISDGNLTIKTRLMAV